MKAAAFMGKKDIEVVDIKEPCAGRDGVVVRMQACGICGSDMHVYNSAMFVESSTIGFGGYRIIGHEFVGQIVEVGEEVTGWQVGDRVASVHNKGGLAEYVGIPGDCLSNLYSLPADLAYTTAATLEPFCNPVHSFHLREPQNGETVAIFGGGILGLGYLQLVKTYTQARTIVVDVSPLRLDVAEKLGADVVLNAREADVVQEIKSLTGEHPVRYLSNTAGGCDIAIDCAGLPLTLGQALEVLKPSEGTAVIASLFEGILPLDPNIVTLKYMTVYGSMGYSDQATREALGLIASGQVQRDLLVTQKFPLEEAARAFAVQGDAAVSVKVVVVNE